MRLVIATLALVSACGSRAVSVSAPPGEVLATPHAADAGPAPRPDETPAQLWAALRQPFSAFARQLGPHRLRIHSRLVRTVPGRPVVEVAQTVELSLDAGGRLWVRKDTHDQYGLELRWLDGWLYLRQRWNRFLRRRASDRQEPWRLADRAYGLLSDDLELLERFVALDSARAVTVLGRAAWQVALRRAEHPPAAFVGGVGRSASAAARRWRRSVQVELLSGSVSLDRATGAPMLARLRARCSFTLPAGRAGPTGIPAPAGAGAARGRLDLELEQSITELGRAGVVAAPPAEEVVAAVRGRRLELERQMVLGERPLDPAWPAL
ncbi:MAG: hypothetical protein IPL40_09470 [Proteobacteria bacterium]|nr:hypothetical protein [Pseudomonadota bacterium]